MTTMTSRTASAPRLLSRWARPLAAAAGAAGLLAGFSASAQALEPVPCTPIDGGKVLCDWWRAGDGYSGGAIVVSQGEVVGHLPRGSNWITCQARGAEVTNSTGARNWWYAQTVAENGRQGWVSALDAQGGDDFGAFTNTPLCGAPIAAAPSAGGIWESSAPTGGGTPAPAPAPEPAPAPPKFPTTPMLPQPAEIPPPAAAPVKPLPSMKPISLTMPLIPVDRSTYRAGQAVRVGERTCTTAFAVRVDGGVRGLSAGACAPAASGATAASASRESFALRGVAGTLLAGASARRSGPARTFGIGRRWAQEVQRGRFTPLSVIGTVATSAQRKGAFVCFTGAASGIDRCGKITGGRKAGAARRSGGLICARVASRAGDVGAPVYAVPRQGSTRAVGVLHSATRDGRTCWVPIARALKALSADEALPAPKVS